MPPRHIIMDARVKAAHDAEYVEGLKRTDHAAGAETSGKIASILLRKVCALNGLTI
jgi:hypothetical protein